MLNNAYLPQAMGNLTVDWLVTNKFIVQEDLAAAASVPSQMTSDDAPDAMGMPDYADQ